MIKEILILPFQTFYDNRYGKVEHSRKLAEKLKQNLDRGILQYPVPVLVSHDSSGGKYGEVRALTIKDEGLAAEIAFNEEGVNLIRSGRYDYISPAYHEKYTNKLTGKDEGETLIEVSLTPTPAQPGLQRIVLSEDDKELVSWSVELELEEHNNKKGGEKMPEEKEIIVIKRYEEELATLRSQAKQFEETLKRNEEQLTKKFEAMIDEKNSEIKTLSEGMNALKAEKHALYVKEWANAWISKRKTPALVRVLSEKLISDPEEETFCDSVLEASPSIPVGRIVSYSETEQEQPTIDIDELAKTFAGVEVKRN